MKIVLIAALTLLATPTFAWETGIEDGLCTLTHAEADVTLRVVHDPSVPLYTITVTRTEGWDVAPEFGMRFGGAQPNTIRTNRHVLSADGRSLSVSDRGFGNVLDGLQFNEVALSFSGDVTATVSLEGAASAVEAFRSCRQVPTV